MSDDAQQPAPAPSTPAASAEALEHVVDDLGPRQEAVDWLCIQILAGRSTEELSAELVAAGAWSQDEADELVEQARRQTRQERGVLTREDVVRDVDSRYRQSMAAGWFTALPTLSSARRLISSIANVMSLKRRR